MSPFDLDELEATFRRYLDRDGPDDAPEWAKGGLWMVERIRGLESALGALVIALMHRPEVAHLLDDARALLASSEDARSGGISGGVPGPVEVPPGQWVCPECDWQNPV